MKDRLAGISLMLISIAIIAETWAPGSVQRFVETVRYEIAVHK